MDSSLTNPTQIPCHVEEKELVFNISNKTRAPLTLLNPNSYALEYKLKSTSPEYYTVEESGKIKPQSKKQLEIKIHPNAPLDKVLDLVEHQFLVKIQNKKMNVAGSKILKSKIIKESSKTDNVTKSTSEEELNEILRSTLLYSYFDWTYYYLFNF
eukprot:gene8845-795_t